MFPSRQDPTASSPPRAAAADAPTLHELASVQQVVWLDQVLDPGVPSYNLGAMWQIEGDLDPVLFESVLNELAAAHDALRLVLQLEAGVARQRVLPELEVKLPVIDLSMHDDARDRAWQHAQTSFATPFQLYGEPLWQTQLLRVGPSSFYWLHRMHHVIGDGATVSLTYLAAWDLYKRRLAGDTTPLEPGPSYLEFLDDDSAYLRSPRYQRDEQFWKQRYAQLPAPLLPVREGVEQRQALPSGQTSLYIERPRLRRFKALAARFGCTLPHAMLALLAAYFARAHQAPEVVIGVPVHNRGTARQKRTWGMFSSIIPVAIDVDPAQSFAALMQGVAAELKRCYRHQRFPIADINRALRLGQHGRKQLFDVTLALEEYPMDIYLGDRKLRVTKMYSGFEQTPLAVCLCDYHEDEPVAVRFNYNTGAFEHEAAEDLPRRIGVLLDAVLDAGDDRPLDDLRWFDDAEREQVLHTWNATAQRYAEHDRCLHEMFEAQVQRTPDAVAVVAGEQRVSYAELNARANQLARELRRRGVGPNQRVGVCLQRSVEMVVALLATLKAGGAYVPLDPDYPEERLRHMLQDSAPVVVLVDAAGREALGQDGLDLQTDVAAWSALSTDNLASTGLTQRHLAYVIYTSGSTGRPKGVMNEHRGVVNRLLWMQQAYALGQHDVVLQKTPFSFDVSVWEFFWPLMTGAQLVMARPEGHKDPAYLAQLIQAAGVTTLHFVPSMLQVFLGHEGAAACRSLQRVICSGEALPAALARSCLAQLPQAQLHNLYGPTEAAVDVTAWTCEPGQVGASVPIGRPIANTQMYILDEQRRPVPRGVAGELYIGGVQVARGYLNLPELTAERFIADPFSADPEARLYKTGDLGRWRDDGAIDYLGRNDFQVKIRGLRIELGEIEARLAQLDGVQEVVVLAREDQPGDQRLVAYYSGEAAPEALRQHAAQGLPAYMVPAAYVQIEHWPVTPNGKLDRKALPAPEGGAYASQAYEAPQGHTEQVLAGLWAELLQVERVGRHDNFFALGGHSLLAVGLIERLRQHGLHADVRALFTTSTLARFAAQLGTETHEVVVPPNLIPPDATRLTPEMVTLVRLGQDALDRIVAQVDGGAPNVQDIYPLAPLQEGILFHHLVQAQGDAYLLCGLLRFKSRPGLERFLTALQQVIDRHDILRTGLLWDGLDQPVQVVHRRATLPVEFVALDPDQGDIGEQLSARYDPGQMRLDVTRPPLLSCHAAQDPVRGGWCLRLLFHHLVLDHTTLELVFEEIQAIEQGQRDRLPAPAAFRDFVAQSRLGLSEQAHEAYFTEMLADIDEPTAPFGLLEVQGDGRDIAEARRPLPSELAVSVRAAARRLGVSVASLMHLAWALVLSRTTGRRDVVFGTVLFGRLQGGAQADRVLGLFINTLPLRLTVDGQGVEDSLRQTHARLVQLLRHEHAPLALAQRCSAVPAQSPLFTSLLNYRYSAVAGPGSLARADGEDIELLSGHERTNYALCLAVDDLGRDLALTVQAAAPVDPQRVCAFMQTALEQLLQALQARPLAPLADIDVLPAAEREQVLNLDHDTQAPGPQDRSVAQLFEAQVQRTPDAVAVIDGDVQLRYADLDRRANQLAHYLRAQGIGPEQRVGVALERNAQMLVAVLGILKAGAAYVPLDPAYPNARLAYLLADAEPALVLTQASLLEVLPAQALVALDTQWPEIAAYPDTAPSWPTSRPDQLAYVIYTSGSTGQPKGVMVEHRSVVNLWWGLEQRIFRDHPACRRVSLNAPIAFDASVQQWVQLLSGRTLVLVPEAVRRDPVALRDFLNEQQVDVFDCTPSQLALMQADGHEVSPVFPRVTLVGGEAIPAALWQSLAARPGQACYNVYGPTECTVDTTCAPITADVSVPHLGRPLANARVVLLDARLAPVPLGVAGEIYIGGAGLARGYLNQSELTAERFVQDPYRPGQRLYKTGDLARRLPDGRLEYLGRNDFQVKVRGHRIELGEIEAQLRQVPGVREAVVVAREDQPGDQRLVAYYRADTALSADALKTHTAAVLPSHMVPAAFVQLDRLPMTPNGKLDRKALPAPDDHAFGSRAYEAPQGEVEQTLARLWCELLGLQRVGRHDHFFELGGHSLLAVQLVSRLRRVLDVELPLADLFEHPQLAALAGHLQRVAPSQLQPIPRADRSRPLPLSLAQQRLWFLTQIEGGSQAYHISGSVRLDGALDRGALQQALQRIVDRHESLRTRYVLHDGQPVQQPAAEARLAFDLHDLRGEADPASAARVLGEAHSAHPFDLGHDLPLRVQLLQLGDEEHLLQLVLHHIAGDGWSVKVLLDELSQLYAAAAAGQPDPLPAPMLQYADYAVWQRGWLAEGQQRQSEFWRATLRDAPSLLELPTDRPRPLQQDYAGASLPVRLDTVLAERLKALSRRHGVTLYMSLLAGWAALLGRLSGQHDVVIGSPVAGRQRAEVEPLIGCFVNTLALRLDVGGTGSVAELLRQTKARVLAAQQHQDLPFDQVVEVVKPPRSLAHTPLFQVMFDWHNTPAPRLALPGLQATVQDTVLTTAQFDLSLSLQEGEGGALVGTLNYATALFEQQTVQAWLDAWARLLGAMAVADERQPVAGLPLLDAAGREQLLRQWNDTRRDLPLHRCAHELFEAQAEHAGECLAVDDGRQRLGYAELNRRANQLAHHLRYLGVGPDTRVALCAERGAEMVVALLAIFKAGGAYVPLDRDYPGDRIAYMLQDSAPVVLLCSPATREVVAPHRPPGLPLLDLHADAPCWQDAPSHNLSPQAIGLTSAHLAYVIYTSGSTGRPKGVMIEHRGLVNYSLDAIRWFGLAPDDRVLQQNSLNFDLSIEEMLPALLAGATLVPSDELFGLQDGRHPGRPSVVHLTAAHWHQLVGEWSGAGLGRPAALAGVRLVNVTGDALAVQKLRQWDTLAPPETRLINTYGPTEITVSCSAAYVRHDPRASRVSIGRPFANTCLYILDERREPVPVGVAGELYIGGAGVARGYLNLPDLTAQRFLQDPFNPGQRLYKTGDLARWRPDGEVEFIGRNDFQVKVRGFRIELAEVEAALAEVDGVQQVVVLAREDQPGEKRLVAYYTGHAGREAPPVDALRQQAGLRLAPYMLPSAYVLLERLPLTPNGKLDRAALPAPEGGDLARVPYEAPEGETESALAGLWAELLKVERVGRRDNFFELGGHSLLAVSLVERMRRRGLHADVRALFITPTLAELAAQVSGAGHEVDVPPNLIAAGPDAAPVSHDIEEFRL
ncbi:peptide synthetase [Caldimonas brevitalea]|uniref:Peptide synthetase n=1 Tax=Caldimonas brevitalea TaxID=413882 RepID=A0A0G3BS85_9BURK|nr:peptide synthetase [Caldimonas brevitalea]